MDTIERIVQFEYFNELLIGVGALLVIIGVLKILGSSIKLLIWVAMACIGAFAVNFGMQRASLSVPVSLSEELKSLVGPGKALSANALQALCRKLDDSEAATQQ